ncbi:MAG: tyrosine--tRNA ligase, partial [Bacteroidales bacterium]|nr:tyrosine--tRNA ligase [Bacteroidales bacterium]
GIPGFQVNVDLFKQGVKAVDLLAEHSSVFPSKAEMRKMVQNGGLSINKNKCLQFDQLLDASFLLHGRYLLIQKGKKNYFLITATSEI